MSDKPSDDFVFAMLDFLLTEEERLDVTARLKKLQRDLIEDVRRIFPQGQILPENSGRGININQLSEEFTGLDAPQDTLDHIVYAILEFVLNKEDQKDLKTKFHKLKQDMIEDIHRIFPQGQILPEGSGRGINIWLPPESTAVNTSGDILENIVYALLESTLDEEDQKNLKAKFHQVKRAMIEDVRRTFPHGQILPENSSKGIKIWLPPKPVGDASEDITDAPGGSEIAALGDVMEIYGMYVNNELPTYLVHVPDKRLVSRQDVKKIFRRTMMAITESDIAKVIQDATGRSQPTREEAIRALVRGKLKYATFSHRWLERGEPTFHDISMSFRPVGYSKLVNFCEKATEYGCSLAWSDTCCINKDSSTELEEAIRSMFKWYRGAHVCIAYLAEATSIDNLWKDVWFTRGWTLQELLAPHTMKFYGKKWVPLSKSLNDKHDPRMLNALSRATGISHHHLRLFRPGTRDVHQKMIWASNRTTTRVEDIAYCLIGIFDVSLTIAYGEGQRAFYRLMEAIINKCGEWEIMAWAGSPSADSAALPVSPRCYRALVGSHAPTAGRGDGFVSQRAWRGDRHFTMTKRGLQLKLLIVDFPSSSMKLFEGRGGKAMECARYGKCMVGVVDYWCFDLRGQGVLRPGQDHLCLLLRSDPSDPDAEWEKVATTELLYVRTDVEVKKDLKTLWL